MIFIQHRHNLELNTIPESNFLTFLTESCSEMAPHIPAPTTQPLEHSSETTYVREEFAWYDSRTQPCICKIHRVSMGWNAFLSLELFSARIEARKSLLSAKIVMVLLLLFFFFKYISSLNFDITVSLPRTQETREYCIEIHVSDRQHDNLEPLSLSL